jgi:hypothetical protein
MNWIKKLFTKKRESEDLENLNTSEVFKISGIPKYTFVERVNFNDKIKDFFRSKDRVLLFLGYSKSGKTVYRKKHLDQENFEVITFRCNNEKSISDLYNQIASELNLGQIITSADASGNKYTTTMTSEIGMKDVAKASAGMTDETSYSYVLTEEHTKVKVDVNFLCNKLQRRNVLIILEDYHLINSDLNKTLSEDLKHFLDDEILFVIIGIPSSPNRTLRNNPDLSGRLEHLIFDYLTKDEVRELVNEGCEKLNVKFSEDVIDEIIKTSMKNAFLVQYICREVLIANGINSTLEKKRQISDKKDV